MSHCYGCGEHDAHCTCFKKVAKVDVEPTKCATPETCPDHAHEAYVPASALAALRQENERLQKQNNIVAKAALDAEEELGEWWEERDTLRAENERFKAKFSEPDAIRYNFDGYGWQYIDNGSGSDWRERVKHLDAQWLVAIPKSED